MRREGGSRAGVGDVVDLAVQLDNDRQKPAGQLRARDREIGRESASLKGSPGNQVLAWLSRVSAGDGHPLGARVARALRIGAVLLGLAGLILGWITAAAVFHYDGSRPVNVIHVLAVFVGAQLILVALLLLTLLPRSVLRWLPGARPVLETTGLLSPGRLQKLASRYLPAEHRRRAAALLGATRAHRVLFGRMEKWVITSSSQLFAVAFNFGALLGCLYLILFSDLAFSWSTTLQVTERDIHSLTSILAAPWSGLVPDADPSLTLIEASRYFRLREGLLPPPGGAEPVGPAVLGGWWPFLVMCMLCYGLLPRLTLWSFSGWRLRSAVDHTILHLPGVTDLLDRMNRELVATQARDAEIVGEPPPPVAGSGPTGHLRGKPCVIINWGDVPLPGEDLSRSAGRTWGCSPEELLTAGGGNTIVHDGEVMKRAVDLVGGGGVIVFVKGWEPPLDDFLDFLGELRLSLPASAPIVVSPVGMDGGPDPAPPDRAQLEMWRTGLQGLGDPWLSVQWLREEES